MFYFVHRGTVALLYKRSLAGNVSLQGCERAYQCGLAFVLGYRVPHSVVYNCQTTCMTSSPAENLPACRLFYTPQRRKITWIYVDKSTVNPICYVHCSVVYSNNGFSKHYPYDFRSLFSCSLKVRVLVCTQRHRSTAV